MIELYSVPTANGQRVHIMLEETGLPYTPHFVDLQGGEHLGEAYMAKNPFGRAPSIIDTDGPGGNPITIFEGLAILLYLAEKSGKFYPADIAVRAEIHTWMSGVAANLGSAFSGQFWFTTLAPEHSEMAIERFVSEAHRGLKALDTHLNGRNFVAGDEYTVADIMAYPVAATSAARLDGGLEPYANIQRWSAPIGERDAVQRGMRLFTDKAPTI